MACPPPSGSSLRGKKAKGGKKKTIAPPGVSDSREGGGTPFVVCLMTPQQKVIAAMYGHERPWFLDSTFGVNQYGFSLYTIMVAGPPHGKSKATGFVIGWVIVSREDAETTAEWLFALTKQIPHVKPSCIVTDAADALRKAVIIVWGEGMRHLLCIWHVWQAWRKAAAQKIKDGEVKQRVLKDLAALQATNFHEPGKEEDEATVEEVRRSIIVLNDVSIPLERHFLSCMPPTHTPCSTSSEQSVQWMTS